MRVKKSTQKELILLVRLFWMMQIEKKVLANKALYVDAACPCRGRLYYLSKGPNEDIKT